MQNFKLRGDDAPIYGRVESVRRSFKKQSKPTKIYTKNIFYHEHWIIKILNFYEENE